MAFWTREFSSYRLSAIFWIVHALVDSSAHDSALGGFQITKVSNEGIARPKVAQLRNFAGFLIDV